MIEKNQGPWSVEERYDESECDDIDCEHDCRIFWVILDVNGDVLAEVFNPADANIMARAG